MVSESIVFKQLGERYIGTNNRRPFSIYRDFTLCSVCADSVERRHISSDFLGYIESDNRG